MRTRSHLIPRFCVLLFDPPVENKHSPLTFSEDRTRITLTLRDLMRVNLFKMEIRHQECRKTCTTAPCILVLTVLSVRYLVLTGWTSDLHYKCWDVASLFDVFFPTETVNDAEYFLQKSHKNLCLSLNLILNLFHLLQAVPVMLASSFTVANTVKTATCKFRLFFCYWIQHVPSTSYHIYLPDIVGIKTEPEQKELA